MQSSLKSCMRKQILESTNDELQLYNLTHSDIECEVHVQQRHRCGTSLMVICDLTKVSFAQTAIQA